MVIMRVSWVLESLGFWRCRTVTGGDDLLLGGDHAFHADGLFQRNGLFDDRWPMGPSSWCWARR